MSQVLLFCVTISQTVVTSLTLDPISVKSLKSEIVLHFYIPST